MEDFIGFQVVDFYTVHTQWIFIYTFHSGNMATTIFRVACQLNLKSLPLPIISTAFLMRRQSRSLGNVEYSFITITFNSTLTRIGNTC